MRRQRRSDLERLQESVHYVPDDELTHKADISNRSKYIHEFYPAMLIQDVHFGIMPIGGRSGQKHFHISLEPPDLKVEEIVEKALAPQEYYRDLESVICNFVGNCAVRLLIYETANYEIVYLRKPKSKTLEGFELVHIDHRTLIHKGNNVTQHIPAELAAKLKKPQHIELTPNNILTFSMPSDYQGMMDQIIESLRVLSVPSAPGFFMQELATGSRKIPYDAKTHIHMHNLALAKATRIIGWNARQLFQNEALEYYLTHRFLSFESFKIALRDNILKTLNEGLERAGKIVGFKAHILVTGLSSRSDVEAAMGRLKAGNSTFKEILEPFIAH